MNTDRERQIRFFKERGYNALEKAAIKFIYRNGAENVLTDDQLAAITSDVVAHERFSNQLNIRNRRITRVSA